MRKLMLQMQISLDGFVAGPNGELDWMEWDWSRDIMDYVYGLHTNIDTILMGHGMAPGFTGHWEAIVADESKDDKFAELMVNTEKIIFSRTISELDGKNVTVEKSELTEAVNRIKNREGGDIIVYGGAGFVTSLIEADLIDEYYLFYNPVLSGKGKSLFGENNNYKRLKLAETKGFECGIILAKYNRI